MREEEFDVVVVGAGAAGLTAAAVAAAEKCRVALLEATPLIGGTSAVSGGMVWMPANPKQEGDTVAMARIYLRETVPGLANESVREAFLARAGEAVEYLESKTSLKFQPVPVYPDYYPNLPGATSGGRVLEALPFDGTELGEKFALLRPPLPEFTLFGGMMISRADIPHLRNVFRRPTSTWKVMKLLARYARQRMTAQRGTTLYLGNALTGRLFKSVLELGVHISLGTAVERLIEEEGRVCGVETVSHDGERARLRAKAVILASGGFSHDAELRKAHLPPAAQPVSATISSGATSGARLARAAGGRINERAANRAFWVPASCFVRKDGTQGVFPHTVTDRGKPGLIAVDRNGRRFVNEALSYHEFVLAMLRQPDSAVPAYLICDSSFLWKYGLGRIKPFSLSCKADIASGYLHRAETIAELAAKLRLPPQALQDTIDAYNAKAEMGEDPEFGRGGDIYQRHLGDAGVRPNPCVAPIRKPPYYAVAVYPADLGTAAGLRTDARARVLAEDDAPIPGLYACGNDMNSVMNGAYPGPGITLGPALTFGYVAAKDAAALR
ncbi:succinate dehydrogenase [Microvirga sp. KLBC 81]|uniref:FAD-dependent oxidoreductase n=1 Tax=Microvirga sp. KLBC 81 TaxID=1862707 RepID=UPI000D50B35F|nr:FAD-dependent oxidoreductase [Microvirga sp. KLBC 81]PVE22997.1 succinate dehydrogenase [Microvirga sp. KLBC 81]